MHIVPPRRQTFRVVRHDGVSWPFEKIDTALAAVRNTLSRPHWFGIWGILGDTFQTTHDYSDREFGGSFTVRHYGFKIVDDLGDAVSKDDLYDHVHRLRTANIKMRPRPKGHFRDGPWPGVYRRRGRRGSCYRQIQTANERAWRDVDDDELHDAGVHPKKVARRRYIPTSWDDIYRSRTRSWKAARANQWK